MLCFLPPVVLLVTHTYSAERETTSWYHRCPRGSCRSHRNTKCGLNDTPVHRADDVATFSLSWTPDLFSDGGGGGEAENVFVTPDSELDLANIFACEGGQFNVSWSGVVTVPETIYIGRGTTVRVVGSNPGSSSNSSSGSSSNSSSGSSSNNRGGLPPTSGGGGGGGGDQQRVEALSTTLPPLPNGLAAAAVRAASGLEKRNIAITTSSAEPFEDDDDVPLADPGPVFFVDGGRLFLEGLAVRGGNAANSTRGGDDYGDNGVAAVASGGGVHAVDATVTVTGCEFENNYANSLGGGIFTNRSTLVVVGSVFRRCQADVLPSVEGDAVGAGGGIGVSRNYHTYRRRVDGVPGLMRCRTVSRESSSLCRSAVSIGIGYSRGAARHVWGFRQVQL